MGVQKKKSIMMRNSLKTGKNKLSGMWVTLDLANWHIKYWKLHSLRNKMRWSYYSMSWIILGMFDSLNFSQSMTLLQTLEDGDMALFDMGAEYNFYGSDITCSFPVSLSINNTSVSVLPNFLAFLLKRWRQAKYNFE